MKKNSLISLFRNHLVSLKNCVHDYWNKRYSEKEFSKPYTDWDIAVLNSTGYKAHDIFEAVFSSAKLVRDNIIPYERDSVAFNEVHHNWPLLSCLLRIAVENNNTLTVLDFGGALGTTFFAIKKFVPSNIHVKWIIVEQDEFVKTGKNEFENDLLFFEENIDAAFAKFNINVVLFSGVLQYLESPLAFIKSLSSFQFEYLLVDRTIFIEGESDKIVVQKVPEEIYKATYPCWLFNQNLFLSSFINAGYNKILEFNSIYDGDSYTFDLKKIYYRGFLFQKNG